MKPILLSATSPRPEPGFFRRFAGASMVAQPPTKKTRVHGCGLFAAIRARGLVLLENQEIKLCSYFINHWLVLFSFSILAIFCSIF
jgi:hypothetical protein